MYDRQLLQEKLTQIDEALQRIRRYSSSNKDLPNLIQAVQTMLYNTKQTVRLLTYR